MAKTPDTETERVHLTAARVRALQFTPGKTRYIFDDDPKQLCVRITESGAKSYVFRGKMSGSSLRITIGSTDSTSLDDARAEARRLKNLIEKGIDPRELAREKAESKASAAKAIEKRRTHTLSALCAAYADHLKAMGKQKSYRDVKSLFKVHVVDAWPDYAATPANEITSHQIASIIRKVREAGKERTAGMLRNCITAAYNAARRAPFDSSMPSSMIENRVVLFCCRPRALNWAAWIKVENSKRLQDVWRSQPFVIQRHSALMAAHAHADRALISATRHEIRPLIRTGLIGPFSRHDQE